MGAFPLSLCGKPHIYVSHHNLLEVRILILCMGGDDADARLVLEVDRQFNGTFVDVSAWSVPKSDRFPDGVKYSMQYGRRDVPEGKDGTIVRYDNFPDHKGAPRHHKHTESGDVEGAEFRGVQELYQRFKQEVRDYGEEWN